MNIDIVEALEIEYAVGCVAGETRKTVCFTHAVQRAMSNQRIFTLVTERAGDCCDCEAKELEKMRDLEERHRSAVRKHLYKEEPTGKLKDFYEGRWANDRKKEDPNGSTRKTPGQEGQG